MGAMVMGKLNVAQFADELGLPVSLLLEQLKAAGLAKKQESDPMTEKDKAKLLEHLRQSHGAEKPAKKITLIRRETIVTEKFDSTGRARAIQLEVHKRRALAQTAVASADAPLKNSEASKEIVAPVNHKRQLRVDHYFSKAKKLLPEHPPESLNNMRKAIEAICKDILDETCEKNAESKILKPASAYTSLEDMAQELKRRKQIPINIEKYLASLQLFGNFGSHDQELNPEDISSEMAESILLQLKAVVDWYKAFDLSAGI
ncbi:MAG: hypothetical protein A3H31_08580 [Gallionellales bacterium RIFCSPLOWO2_02_FULL_57_47]|nr:MAG: hypothetical protein A3H31_08580 [Gallionellales bacterium RIFCSPLOWO2_02_FULL_57_47]OGT13073.1 MAG: hypothetical protein A3J49_08170 [Gallionellales bacterium RIFCSPHIGHO2_02_FULL_57_16]